MSVEQLIAVADAIGWPVALAIFIGVVLAKNGWLKVIMRDDRRDEMKAIQARQQVQDEHVTSLERDVRTLQEKDAEKTNLISKLITDIAVLNDRWSRKD